jgi:hypothetical protein
VRRLGAQDARGSLLRALRLRRHTGIMQYPPRVTR